MRLAKLKLAGFKSFVDPTTMLTPGYLVGVVGPNGCGKSNIIDAVRWVLGETKAGALRGESMQDVIFGGSVSRKAVSRASVELVFDNNQGKAAGQWAQYAEIAVRRVLQRDGDSTYFINGQKVRRRDVVDLFLGTGLGPRAYAIIEQGTISRVIEARPDELRMFLEEAAGITKYKERRRETESRLRDARENLERVADVRVELDAQIVRLEAQAAVAIRYRELHASLAHRQHLLWFARCVSAARERERLTRDADEVGLSIERETARMREVESNLELAREHHLDAGNQLHDAQAALFAASADVARLEADLRHQREGLRKLKERVAQIGEDQQRWANEAAGLKAASLTLEDDQARIEAELEAARDAREMAHLRLLECDEAWSALRESVAESQRRLSGAEQALRVHEAHQANAQRQCAALAGHRERLVAELANLPRPDTARLGALNDALTAAQDMAAERAARLEELEGSLPELEDALRACENAHGEIQRRLTDQQARANALRQLQDKVARSGKLGDWLARHGLAEAQPLWRRVRVAEGWETALEAVLASRVNAYVQHASAAQTALTDPPPSRLALVSPPDHPVHGMALDASGLAGLVETDEPGWRVVLDEWLRHVRPVDDLGQLSDDQRADPAITWVDRRGHICAGYALVPYLPDALAHGALERQRELEQLAAQLPDLVEKASDAESARARARQRLASQRDAVSACRGDASEARAREHGIRLDLVRRSEEAQRLDERIGRLEGQLDEAGMGLEREEAALAMAEEAISGAMEILDIARDGAAGTKEQAGEAEARLRAARDAERGAADRAQRLSFALKECLGLMAENARTRQTCVEQLERLRTERGEREAELAQLAGQDPDASLQAAIALRVAREQATAGARDGLEAAAARLRGLDEARLKTESGIGPLRDRLQDLTLKAQAAEIAEQQYAERLTEASANIERLRADHAEGINESAVQAQVTRMQNEVAAMGAVNLAAVEELDKTRERKQFLDAQVADLTSAIETLESAIRRIDRETREQLSSTFDFVNERFGQLFPELFGGGEARLILSGDEILDAGVQVSAQPPGKKTSNIHLLSGGEKALTAVALVFSLFQLNPAPFCMLDEVDAPLDDTNTERYGRMLKKMSLTTQFVFITHSKITMEIAQQLVGVTMQESGVSRIVEVDVEEALRLTGEAAA